MPEFILTTRKFRGYVSETRFLTSYLKLLRFEKLEESEWGLLLGVGVFSLNFGDENMRKFGYALLLEHLKQTHQAKPFRDLALSLNYVPVAKLIDMKYSSSIAYPELARIIEHSYMENFEHEGKYFTEGQIRLRLAALEKESSQLLVAPTSYGKSEAIGDFITKNLDKNVCILVPTKALLNQTRDSIRKRLIENGSQRRILVHPDAYQKKGSVLAILTQERLLKLLNEHREITFDSILVDEAHGLMGKEDRDALLATVLILACSRNENTILKFFTPFLENKESIEIPLIGKKLVETRIHEHVKCEEFYLVTVQHDSYSLERYDPFLSIFEETGKGHLSEIEFIRSMLARKNIIYLNKPSDIENVSRLLLLQQSDLEESNSEFCDVISDYIHPEYLLVDTARQGIVYHHGGVPNIVRLYIEREFTNNPDLRVIITSSTLLEGVNIPADRLFILQNVKGRRSLSASQTKNLIGRVSRFGDIFNEQYGSVQMLTPQIYFFKSDWVRKDANLKNYMKKVLQVDKKNSDVKENPLLLSDEEKKNLSDSGKKDLKDALTRLENIEPGVTKAKGVDLAATTIGKQLFVNNVKEFSILKYEKLFQERYERKKLSSKIASAEDLIETIYDFFLHGIDLNDISEDAFKRLKSDATRKFYTMFLNWRIEAKHYKSMIASFVSYWQKETSQLTYVGPRWGEVKRNEADYRSSYVEISKKSYKELVNLAIVKIKEEQDFVDNHLVKFAEIFYDLDLLEEALYHQIKYGTSNVKAIMLLKDGLSLDLTRLLMEPKYVRYVHFDLENKVYQIQPSLLDLLEKNSENRIHIFELEQLLGKQ